MTDRPLSDIEILIIIILTVVVLGAGFVFYYDPRLSQLVKDAYFDLSQRADSVVHPPTPTPIPPPTATPDVPRFVSGEAIATAKTWLSRRRPRGEGFRDCLQLYEALRVGAVWRESYEGQGVWRVQFDDSWWLVYEKSLAVGPISVGQLGRARGC